MSPVHTVPKRLTFDLPSCSGLRTGRSTLEDRPVAQKRPFTPKVIDVPLMIVVDIWLGTLR